jgi:ribosomal protein L21E
MVRVLEGKFQGETGIVINVDESNVTTPFVKLDSTQREVQIPTNHLKLKNDKDKDD